jgi:hypothetical protein
MKKRGIDPILEEVDEVRRRIMAEHGNDWRKVLDHYVEVGRQAPDRVVRVPNPDDKDQSAA